ncbi:MAG: 3-phosphoshikimate 1-carboxyvinyltransferase [Patescibacteria group bacterium]|jgi:3-phosphoshikimate 1-carboxyvinyltransferase
MKALKITIPGSKSLTNRAILMASLSNGSSKIKNISNSLDSLIMIRAMKKLGIRIKVNKNELKISGNRGVFQEFNGMIEAGQAGTVTRFLTALSVLIPGQMTVKSTMAKDRPIKELGNALKKIRTGKVSISGSISSQFISSLLMIAPVLEKGLIIKITGRLVSSSYIDMTIDLMKKFGIKVEKINNNKLKIKKQSYRSTDYVVESDLSGASYFFAAAAVTGKPIRINNIEFDSVQGDLEFSNLLEKMGSRVRKNIRQKWIEVKGPKVLKGINADMVNLPDTAQTLAVVAAFAKGKTKIIGLSTLKIKETNRLQALKNELEAMKIKSEIKYDSIIITGGKPQKTTIKTYGDHRMAMAFAVAKLRIPELKIKNPEVVKKSFPEFWEKFKKI